MAKTTKSPRAPKRVAKGVDASDIAWTAEAKKAKRALDKKRAKKSRWLVTRSQPSVEALWQAVRTDERFIHRLTRALPDTACHEELGRFLLAAESPAVPEHLDEGAAAATLVMGGSCFELLPFWLKARGITFMLNVAEVVGRRGLSEECDGLRCWIVADSPDLRYSAYRWIRELGDHLETEADADRARQTARTLAAGMREHAPAAARWALSTIVREPAWIDSDIERALREPGPFPLPMLAYAGDLERATQLLRAQPSTEHALEDLAPFSLDLVERRGDQCAAFLGEIARQAAAALRAAKVPHDAYSWPVDLERWEPLLHAIRVVGGAAAIEAVVELLSAVGDTKLTKDAALARGVGVTVLVKHAAIALPWVEARTAESWTRPILEPLRRAAAS